MSGRLEYSPFQPGVPVSPDRFVGRESLLREMDRYIRQAAQGKQQHTMLLGDRGVGKTSLANYVLHHAEQKHKMLGVHTFMGGVENVEEVVRRIFDALIKKTSRETWFSKVQKFFGDRIEEVGLFGVTLNFRPTAIELDTLVRNFPDVLHNFIEKVASEHHGLMIVLDDINGLADSGTFPNWYKSFVDYIATHFQKMPVYFCIIGVPDRRDAFFQVQPSLMRIFQVLEANRLSEEETRNFYTSAFKSVEVSIGDLWLNMMVSFSAGYPILMQEIGDCIFWELVKQGSSTLTSECVDRGIIEAADRIGKRYLDATFYTLVRSEKYKSIMHTIAELHSNGFSRKEVENALTGDERKVLSNCLRKMRELGVLVQDETRGRGHYSFPNQLYPLYLLMNALRESKRKRRFK